MRHRAIALGLLAALAGLAGCASLQPAKPPSDAALRDTAPDAPSAGTAGTVALLAAVDHAEQLYAQARFEAAFDAFRALVERSPRNPYFWFRLGNCSAQLKRYGEAARAFEQASRLDPSDGRFAYNLAFAHSALARDAFAQARAQLPPGSPWRLEAEQNRRLMEAVVGTPPR